ncbi:phospholipase D-like domain-containing protein [[Kitasatospora] papulosa]|uniref:phospholipase D-like domain-containing protein n=1 Tax=[Kitasatospora] papulosa TaxID=1464011 RepID=UPI0036CA8316
MPEFSADSLLAVRYHQARPGLDLVAIVDAGLPVSLITADVLAQERKDLPLLDEFLLRLVNDGVSSETAITGLLGLPDRMVTQTLAQQFSQDYLAYGLPRPGAEPKSRPLLLTRRGEQAARDHAAIAPARVNQRIVYDQLLRKVRPYERNILRPRGQAEEEGVLLLPAAHQGPIATGDISADDINTLLRESGNSRRDVLLIKNLTQDKARRVMPAKVLVYADADRSDIQLGIVVDGELSHPHELALISQGGAKALGITVESAPERPALEPALEQARTALPDTTQHRSEQAAIHLSGPGPVPQQQNSAGQVAPAHEIRAIGVFEHPDLLDRALTQARKRLLIISPWIKKAIITTEFLSKLETRLQRGVTVHIAYGYEDVDTKSDPLAIRRLENLAARYKEKFVFSRLKSTHAKVLVFDDTWVTTSFNWLSFKGDRDRTYRMEEGTLVHDKQVTDPHYSRYLELIEQQRK